MKVSNRRDERGLSEVSRSLLQRGTTEFVTRTDVSVEEAVEVVRYIWKNGKPHHREGVVAALYLFSHMPPKGRKQKRGAR